MRCVPVAGPFRICIGRNSIIILVKPICDPLPDIACHIQYTVWTCSKGIPVNRNGLTDKRQIEVCQARVGGLISPGISAPIGASSGFFPLSFGWQTPSGPLAIRVRLIPVDPNHRVITISPNPKESIIPCGWRTNSCIETFGIHCIGDVKLIHPKRIQVNAMLRIIPSLCIRAAHNELTGGDVDLGHAVFL